MPHVLPSQVIIVIDHFISAMHGRKTSSLSRHEVKHFTMDDLPQLSAILRLVRGIPENLIVLEGAAYARYVACIAEIESIVMVLQQRGESDLHTQVIQRSYYVSDDNYWISVDDLRDLLAKCPDQYPNQEIAALAFIDDKDLRSDLRMDINDMEKALVNGEWKNTTVMAGAVMEALLLWVIQHRDPKDVQDAALRAVNAKTLDKPPPSDPSNWGLPQFIEVAGELKILGSDAVKQARLAQDFRNLIHPGRALRKGQKCDRSTALSAVAAVAHTVKALTPKK